MSDDTRARQVGRRESLRSGIPDHVPIPKFLTTSEINEIKRVKEEDQSKTWESAVAEVIARLGMK